MINKRLPVLLLSLFLVCPSGIHAAELSTTEAMALGQSLGSERQGDLEGLSTNQSADTVPGYQGTDVPETQYGNNPMAMEDEARQQVNQNETGSFVSDATVDRPQFQFDRETDPLLIHSNAIQDDPESVIGSIESAYSDCQSSIISTPPTYSEEVCTEWRESERHRCTETLQLSCERTLECDGGIITLRSIEHDMRWDYTYPFLTIGSSRDDLWGGYCHAVDRRTTFNIDDINRVVEFTLIQARFDDWIRISVNGNIVYVGPHGGDRLNVYFNWDYYNYDYLFNLVQYAPASWGLCELGTNWNQTLNIDIKPYLRTGINTIDMRVVVSGAGNGSMKFRATQYCDCEWSEQWASTCDGVGAELSSGRCLPPTRLCTEPAETRIIDGMPTYRDCWAYEENYECAAPSTIEEDYCATLRARGCSQIGSQCTGTMESGLCESYDQLYQCETAPGTSSEVIDCGGQTMCMDGNCFDTSYEPSQDLGVAAASLGVITDAAADFDVDANIIFRGDALKCGKAMLGFSNCCKVAGWGQNLGLTQCNSTEQRLSLARRAGLCHYVGSYCSKKNFFGCISRKASYCCFKSKLARIIHEQGRAQLGMGWGSAKTPQCNGLTLEQLQSLDFSTIDFSEFFADALGNANSPNSAELQGLVEQYIQQSMPQ